MTKFKTGVKRKSAPNLTNWQFIDHPAAKELQKTTLPKVVNLKDRFPPVYLQTCGCCTSEAALACDAYYYHMPDKGWVPSAVFTYYNQRIMDDDDMTEDDGSCVELALDAVRKFGACNSKVWSNDEPFNKKPSKEAYKDGLKGHEVTKYFNVKSFTQIKQALYKGYPVATPITWAFDDYGYDENFILFDPTPKQIDDCDKGHAIVIVGYDDNKKLYEIRNSWGPDWGNKGYAYITYKTMKLVMAADDFLDTYAVVK